MTLILGTEFCKVDSNGRFKFPIRLKSQLETEDCRFVIRQGFTAECLELWTYSSFQQEVECLQKMLNPYSIQDAQIMRQMTKANLVELDSNDRLMIPPERKGPIGDAKEIVLQSTGKCIEIWERSAYDKMNQAAAESDYASVVNKRLGELHGLPLAGDAE